MTVDPAFTLIARAGLALLFTAAALHKARDLAGFSRTVASYRVLPESLAPVLAQALVVMEGFLVAVLAIPGLDPAGGAGAVLLLGVYSIAIAINLARGRRDIDCGCLGPAGRQPLSGWLLARNAFLMAGGFVLAAPQASRSLAWVDAVSVIGGVGMLVLLWNAGNRLGATWPALHTLRRSS